MSVIETRFAPWPALLALLGAAGFCAQADTVYVSSQNSQFIAGYNSTSGVQLFQDNLAGAGVPIGLALDNRGNLYAGLFTPGASANTVQKFTFSGTPVGTYATLGPGLDGPFDMAFDKAGNLYVSVLNSNVVLKYDINGLNPITLANISRPRGMTFDSSGNLFIVSDTPKSPAVIKLTDLTTPNQNPGNFFTSNLSDPRYAVFDSAGTLYVSNGNLGGNNMTGYIERYQVTGPFADLGNFGPLGMGGPNGLGFDGGGNLFAANYFTNNVSSFTSTGAVKNANFATGIPGANGLAIGIVPEPATPYFIGLGVCVLALRRHWARP